MKNAIRGAYFLARFPFILFLKIIFPSRKTGQAVPKILVLRPDRIGDLVLTTPLLENLRKAFPSAKIDLAVRPRLKSLAECIDTVDRVLLLDGPGTAGRMRKEGYDICIDPVCDWRLSSAYLCLVTGAPLRIGFSGGWRELFFNHHVRPEDFPDKDMAGLMLELLKAAGIPCQEIPPKLTIKAKPVSGRPFVVLHIGGFYPAQRWPAERFIALARLLLAGYGVDLVFIGSAQEKAGVGAVVSAVNDSHCRSFFGGLNELASLLASSRLFIGNNSGPLHLAAALGVATVSMMGPSDPRFLPRGEKNLVIRKKLECSPCGRGNCRSHRCMEMIEVEEVFGAARAALEGRKAQEFSGERPGKTALLDKVGSILVLNLGGIGDMVLSFPAIRALKAAYPRAGIDLLCVSRVSPLAESAGIFRKIHVSSSNPLVSPGLMVTLRKNRYDLAVNMRTLASFPGAVKMRLVFALINARITAGRDTDGRGRFFAVRIPEKEPGEKYEMDYDLETVRALGADTADVRTGLEIDPESAALVRRLLENAGVMPGELLIGVHPGGMASRRWPADNFIALMKALAQRLPCRFVVTGSGGETGLGKKLAEAAGALNLTGKLDLPGTIALIGACGLFISNDTGPMHLAAALRVPLVAIFGPGQLTRFDPRAITDKARVLYRPSDCAPCENKYCAELKCLTSIKTEEALEAALSLLSSEGIR